MDECLLTGKTVTFSIKKDVTLKGKVLSKIQMRDKPGSDLIVTGFVIEEEETGKLHNNIHHWRIQEVHN